MKLLKDSADFWHFIWISSGKPLKTITHSIMKKTKNKYHHQVRRCRRSANYIANFRIAENTLRDDGYLFKELTQARKEDDETALVVDGKAGREIPNVFAEKYAKLYNNNENNVGRTTVVAKLIARLNTIYISSFYAASLWDFNSVDFKKTLNSWSKSVWVM